ncbi:unnamed protein product [Closterium sp. NIES-54]
MACTRALQQQGQQQHSRQWGPAGPKCGAPSPDHSASHCYRRLDDLRRERFGPHAITPHWPSRLRQRTAAPDESHPPGLGPFPAARVETCVSSLGACVVSSPAAFERLCVGAAATTILAPAFVAALGATSQTAQLSFTLDSGASNCFFHDCTDLTPLRTLVTVALADPSVGLPQLLAPLPCSPAPSYTPCVEGRQRAAPHSSSFPPTMSPFHTLHLDVWGPSLVLGPRQERYFLIVEDEYSRYTTVFPLRRKVDVPTVLEPWLLARGGAQALCGLHLQSDRGVRYAAHQLNLWPSDARPRVTLVSLWTGSLGVAADFRVWGSLAHVRAPGANKLSLCTRACIFLGFPLDTASWVFYDPLTYEFFSSQDVTFDESVCYYRSRPHQGVLHATPQSSPLQRPVPVESGGAGGAVAEGEGVGAAGVGGVGSGGAGGVGVEVTLVEDTAASTRRPRPASPPGFPSVPQFPTRSSLRPVAAEPGGVPAGGTGGPGGVGGGGAGSGGAGA